MDWYRAYHGLCTDPKLHKASRIARVRRSVAIAGWMAVLESASKESDRGSLNGLDAVDLAFMIDESQAVAGRILEAFRALRMIDDGRVKAWSKRQFASDDVAIRVKKHREQTAKPLKTNETASRCNVSETHQNRTDSDTDKKDTPVRGADAPNGQTSKGALWSEMKAQIGGKNPGALVGRWVKDHGLEAVAAAHWAAMANAPADYTAWMVGRLKAQGRPPPNGKATDPFLDAARSLMEEYRNGTIAEAAVIEGTCDSEPREAAKPGALVTEDRGRSQGHTGSHDGRTDLLPSGSGHRWLPPVGPPEAQLALPVRVARLH